MISIFSFNLRSALRCFLGEMCSSPMTACWRSTPSVWSAWLVSPAASALSWPGCWSGRWHWPAPGWSDPSPLPQPYWDHLPVRIIKKKKKKSFQNVSGTITGRLLISIPHLNIIVFAVVCHSVEVAVVINKILPGCRRLLKNLSNNFWKVLLLRHFSHSAQLTKALEEKGI